MRFFYQQIKKGQRQTAKKGDGPAQHKDGNTKKLKG